MKNLLEILEMKNIITEIKKKINMWVKYWNA